MAGLTLPFPKIVGYIFKFNNFSLKFASLKKSTGQITKVEQKSKDIRSSDVINDLLVIFVHLVQGGK
jgi:hypothetical protein